MPESSRRRYRAFVTAYRNGALGPSAEPGPPSPEVGEDRESPAPVQQGGYRRAYAKWLWPHRTAIAGVFGLALLGAGLEMVEPLFMRFIIDRVLLDGAYSRAERLHRLNLAGMVFGGMIVCGSLVRVVRDYRQKRLNDHVMLSLRRALFDRMLHLPLARLQDMKTGGVLSRLTGDVETTSGLLQTAVVVPSVAALRLLIAVSVLMAVNWRLALAGLAIMPGILMVSLSLTRRVRPIYRSIRKDAESIDGRVGETFAGIRVVRAFARERRERAEYIFGRHAVLRKELFAHRRDLLVWTSWSVLTSTATLGILWYGGYLYVQGRASVGDIIAFQWYTLLLMNPVWNLVNSWSELQRSLAAMDRVFEVLVMANDKPDRPGARDAPSVIHQLRFEDVTFEYRKGHPVVRDFTLVVPGGSVVALVGRSGAGKTTVTDLVARFHDPTHGRILVNGTDIREFTLASYRRLLAVVQQNVFLFDGSVRDNIAYGLRHATDAAVEDAARRANAHEFIVRLPEGYETRIGERGVRLSGGQQQRLAIARALLAAPQIQILDEATSNLDTESEQLIQESMSTLLSGRTTFVIAHRLSTIRRADLILLMEHGRVVERGTHRELMDARGAYYRMVRRQMEFTTDDGGLLDAEVTPA